MARPRTYLLNEKYFDIIDSEKKAYILGFIYADGSVCRTTLNISLSEKDIEILHFIKSELEYSGNIKHYCIKDHNYVSLIITSKYLTDSLRNIGIISNKTYLSQTLPIVSEKYQKDLIRGFFDGDGSVYMVKYRNSVELTFNLSNNKYILTEIKNIFINNNISSSVIRCKKTIFSSMMDVKGTLNLMRLYEFIYHDENLFSLKRKHDIFKKIYTIYDSRKVKRFKEDLTQDIIQKYNNGMRQFQIAKELKLKASSVRAVIQKARRNNLIIKNYG